MNFSQALEWIKLGKKLTRTNWNGKGMFVYVVDGSDFETNHSALVPNGDKEISIKYRPHIDLKAADGTYGVWSISNNDVLAEDWEVVE